MFPARIVVLSRVTPGSRRGLSFAKAPLEGRAGVVRDVESALPLFGVCVHGLVKGSKTQRLFSCSPLASPLDTWERG